MVKFSRIPPAVALTIMLAGTAFLSVTSTVYADNASQTAPVTQSLSGKTSEQLCDRGDQALQSGDFDSAFADYSAAYQRLAGESGISQETCLMVEKRYVLALSYGPGSADPGAKTSALGLAILHDSSASPARQTFALSLLRARLVSSKALEAANQAQYIRPSEPAPLPADEITFCEHFLRTVIQTNAVSSPDQLELCSVAADLLPKVELSLVGLQLQKAEVQEESEDWPSAMASYTAAVAEAKDVLANGSVGIFSPDQTSTLNRQSIAAVQAVSFLRQRVNQPGSSPCSFLGVDHTAGGDWQNSLGHEAWVLFAASLGDFCGGPDFANSSFSYKTTIPDPTREIERYHDDHAGPSSLYNPLQPAVRITSFLNDGGEGCPGETGPDAYIHVSIPAGAHILSFAVHFSSPLPVQGHHSIYLLSGDGTDAFQTSQCLASGVVSGSDEGGYARFAVTGPARYTVVFRRLECLNTNIPAMFLDPDPRTQPPPALADLFPEADLESTTRLTDIVHQYGRLRGSVAKPDWSETAQQAAVAAADSTLTQPQRVIAAYVAWQAEERCPLALGSVEAPFEEYLSLIYPPSGHAEDDMLAVSVLAQNLNDAGYIQLAEKADDKLWDMEVQNAAASTTDIQNNLIGELWIHICRPYLKIQICYMWSGEDTAAPTVNLFCPGIAYVAQKARMLVQAAVSNDYMLGLLTTPAARPAASAAQVVTSGDLDASRARSVLDDIAQELNVSVYGATASTLDQTAKQPIPSEYKIYVAAADPLLGRELGDQSTGSAQSQDCLLTSSQLETLGVAMTSQDSAPGDPFTDDQARELKLLRYIQAHDPKYTWIDRVNMKVKGFEAIVPR